MFWCFWFCWHFAFVNFNFNISKISTAGTWLQTIFVAAGQVSYDEATSIAVDQTGNLYVSSFRGSVILKFTAAGTFVSTIGASDFGGTHTPIALDAAGNIYASNRDHSGNSKLLKYNAAGTRLNRWGNLSTYSSLMLDAVGNYYFYDSQASVTVGKSVTESEKAAAAAAVNLTDAIAILKMIVGLPVNATGTATSPYQVVAADYNRDGNVALTDAIDVLKSVVGLNAPAPGWVILDQSKVTSSTTMDSYNADKTKTTGWMSSNLSVDLDKTPEIQLVGVLAGDVDGSWAG